MRLSIMQPSYIPWLGYFDLIKRSDVFVFYDDVQYTKNDWRNRNRIKTSQGYCWLTIPVSGYGRRINEVSIPKGSWAEKHLKTLQMNYPKAPFFEPVYDLFDICLKRYAGETLDKLCIGGIEMIMSYMGVPFKHLLSSVVGFSYLHKTDRLITLCKALGANEYLSPNGAKAYIDEKEFDRTSIKLMWQDYQHPVYTQLWGEFLPCLSIVDLLFNYGPKSWELI